MRIYHPVDEEKIRTTAHLREWTRSGLIEPAQSAAIENDLTTELRQTGLALRVALFVITTIVIGAEVGLWAFSTSHISERQAGVAFLFFGAVNVAAAEWAIRRFSFYRHGVEESLAAIGAVLIVVGAVLVLPERETFRTAVAWFIFGAVGATAVYIRYGGWYAAFAAAACIVWIPEAFDLTDLTRRMTAAGLCLMVFGFAHVFRHRDDNEVRHDDFEWLEAAAWAGLYYYVHLRLYLRFDFDFQPTLDVTSRSITTASYILIWLIPIAGLIIGIRGRLPWMIRVNGLMAIVTLATHKEYLGWPSHDYDPILLGVFLFVVAVALRRWLAAGTNGHRGVYTGDRILAREKDQRSMASMLGGLKTPGPAHTEGAPAAEPYEPGGGASGGAGSAGKF